MKQVNLFGQEFAPNQNEQKYSSKIEAPIIGEEEYMHRRGYEKAISDVLSNLMKFI